MIFFLIQNKNLRYTLPLLPAAAIVAAAAVAALPPRARRAVTWACVAVGALQVGAAAFAVPSPTVLAPLVPELAFSRPPDGRDWHHRELLAAVAAAAGAGEARVAVVANDNYFSVSNFRYEVVRDRLPLRLSRAWDQAPMGVDFAIVKTGDQGPDAASAKPDRIMAALEGGDPWLAAAYPVIARVPLPDGSEGMVRMRRLEPVRSLTGAQLAERLRRGAEGLLADVVRDARGLRMTLDYRDDALLAGQVDHVILEADAALVGEFTRRPSRRSASGRCGSGRAGSCSIRADWPPPGWSSCWTCARSRWSGSGSPRRISASSWPGSGVSPGSRPPSSHAGSASTGRCPARTSGRGSTSARVRSQRRSRSTSTRSATGGSACPISWCAGS